jgi:hypothetical protein
MASVLVREEGRLRLYNKGAAEWVLRRCVSMRNERGELVPMTEELREELMEVRVRACCAGGGGGGAAGLLLCCFGRRLAW